MNLIYRGITYKRHSSKASERPFQRVIESKAARNFSYRGVTYRLDPHAKPASVPVEPVTYKLIYRGVTYYKLLYRGVIYLVNRNA